MGPFQAAKFLLSAIMDDIDNVVWRKKGVNIDVFNIPGKYAICLPIKEVVADSKVSKEGVEHYKEKIRKNEEIDPIIVTKHPNHNRYAVLDGHHRYFAFLEMGATELNCAVAGDFSIVFFYLTKKGYFQPSGSFTEYLRQPVKRFHGNLKEFLDDFAKKS